MATINRSRVTAANHVPPSYSARQENARCTPAVSARGRTRRLPATRIRHAVRDRKRILRVEFL